MKREIRYAYHAASDKVIHISEAERGLRCGCKCQDCESDLEAVKGTERTHYFRHANGKYCNGETAMHLFAKQVIATSNNINLPNGRLFYENVRVEKTFNTKRPDVTVSSQGEDLHFEIRVSHAVKEDKRQFYCDGKHKSIEIDLSDRSLWLLSPEVLKELILEETYNKDIVFWDQEKVVATYEEKSAFDFWSIVAFIATILLLILTVIFSKK